MPEMGLGVEELAAELGISKNTIYDSLIAENLIPYVRIGRTIRIPRSAFARWFDFMAVRHVDVHEVDAIRAAMNTDEYRDSMRSNA